MITISRSELQKLRSLASNEPSGPISKLQREADLKKLSADRVSKWPNTLDAIKKKKENSIIEKARERELFLQQIDREEEEHRRQERQQAIERAEALLYDQTDKMQLFRSNKLYCDVLDTRKQQLDEKQRRINQEQQEKAEYHEVLMNQLHHANELEEQKQLKQKQVIKSVAQTREEQLREVQQRHAGIKEESRKIGEAMKLQAQLDYEKELKEHVEQQEHIKKSNEDMIRYNEKLKQIKLEIQRKEAEAQALRDKEVSQIEERANGRKEIERIRQMNRTKKRQDLINAATQQLQAMTTKENEILLKQEIDIKEKQDRELIEKERKKKEDWERTIQSRTQQIEQKKQKQIQQNVEDQHQIQAFLHQNQVELTKELEKIKLAKQKTITLKQQQYLDYLRRQENILQEKLRNKQDAIDAYNSHNHDNDKFIQICTTQIQLNERVGKPTYPLKMALQTVIPPKVKKSRDMRDDDDL